MSETIVVHPPEAVPDHGSEVITEPLEYPVPRPNREREVESWPAPAISDAFVHAQSSGRVALVNRGDP